MTHREQRIKDPEHLGPDLHKKAAAAVVGNQLLHNLALIPAASAATVVTGRHGMPMSLGLGCMVNPQTLYYKPNNIHQEQSMPEVSAMSVHPSAIHGTIAALCDTTVERSKHRWILELPGEPKARLPSRCSSTRTEMEVYRCYRDARRKTSRERMLKLLNQ